ncbi:MAG: ATP-binding protein [Caldisericota bacterium]|nr:ATP-binding protein [Caldisericota bacterium]
MSLTLSSELLFATTAEQLERYRKLASTTIKDREVSIETVDLGEAALLDIIRAASATRDTKSARAAESILQARQGAFDRAVPNFKAFKGVLEAFLKCDLIDGWIYVNEDDGTVYPELVTHISFDDGQTYGRGKGSQVVRVHTISYGLLGESGHRSKIGNKSNTHTFSPRDVANRKMTDILSAFGIFKETQALKSAYLASLERYQTSIQDAFSKQFRISGKVYRFEESNHMRRGFNLENRRVIHDLEAKDFGPYARYAESDLLSHGLGNGVVPEHPVVRLFDLRTHEFLWAHSDTLEPHKYDKSLRDKLVLPATHRDLLDVLTTDLDAFVDDFIEGKSAGNVILCKGIPGVGKTLTAEVYAELIEQPLYSIHSGSLGTTVESIESNLKEIFQRGKRWGCVLLLDEADVYVAKRGNNIEQNAIVAEFLRTLEYFDGLLFLTTNRPQDVDDAIEHRCAAIIEYLAPEKEDAAAIWRVMAAQYKAVLSETLIEGLLALFPTLTPRDIKMLFRLALRVSARNKEELSLETFRQCAMFRAIPIANALPRRADGKRATSFDPTLSEAY